MAESVWIGLAEAVRGIRAELEEATRAGADARMRFELGTIELELTVDLRRDVAAGAGVKVWVASADARASTSAAHAHRLTVTLQPHWADTGGSVDIQSYEDEPDDGGNDAERPNGT